MRKSVRLGLLGLGLAVPAVSQASVVSFHDADQGYSYYSGYNVLMYGQGAASDPGNNYWNGFSHQNGGPGSTAFFGPGNTNSGHGAVPNNSPANPYAWYNGGSSTGTNLFSPSNSGANPVSALTNVNSDGTPSPVTLSLSYGGDNGINNVHAQSNVVQGTPSWILSEAALTANSTTPGLFTLGNVPAGTYDLYLYGANYNGDRGAVFNVSNSTYTAAGGYTATMNPGGGPLQTYVLGQDYVEFIGVTPDANGNIIGSWSAVTNTTTGQSGEGDFNGLQLVSVPEPTSMALVGLASAGLLSRRRRRA